MRPMLGYYFTLVRGLPGALLEAGNRWLTVVALALALLAWLGVLDDAVELPPWAALAPVAADALFVLARRNWENLRDAREGAARTRQAEELAGLRGEEATQWRQRYEVSQRQYETLRQFDEEQRSKP